MKTTQLPVFRVMYDLNHLIFKVVDKFPKQYKYNLGSEMISLSIKLFKHLFKANRLKDDKVKRVECIDEFLDDFDLLRVMIRMVNEERLIGLKDTANLALITDNITKQINGWRRNISEKINEGND